MKLNVAISKVMNNIFNLIVLRFNQMTKTVRKLMIHPIKCIKITICGPQ